MKKHIVHGPWSLCRSVPILLSLCPRFVDGHWWPLLFWCFSDLHSGPILSNFDRLGLSSCNFLGQSFLILIGLVLVLVIFCFVQFRFSVQQCVLAVALRTEMASASLLASTSLTASGSSFRLINQ
jgi:hypothetical protein